MTPDDLPRLEPTLETSATPPRVARPGPPAEELAPLTFKWLAVLPALQRPDHLPRRFPRIANELARLFPRPQLYLPYLEELLIDRRGGRRGFPPEVRLEIERLRMHAYSLPARLSR